MSNPVVISELKRIAAAHGGMLNAEDIVDAARPANSVLHSRFQWDDTKAAHEYRMLQARQLVRVTVEYCGPQDKQILQRVFVSLTPDRTEGGGYRQLVSVMTEDGQRARLLADAVDELQRIRTKYEGLAELAEVFAAIEEVAPIVAPARRRNRRNQPQPEV